MEQQEQLTPQQHRELIKSNIVGSYNNPEKFIEKSNNIDAFNELIKGDISGNFSYRESISIVKKGKEIKEKLELLLALHLTEFTTLQQQISQIPIDLGVQPTASDTSDWYDVKVAFLPARYTWEVIDQANEDVRESYRNYNRLVERIIDCQVEQKMINAMLKNLDDNKDYPLSVKQIIALNL